MPSRVLWNLHTRLQDAMEIWTGRSSHERASQGRSGVQPRPNVLILSGTEAKCQAISSRNTNSRTCCLRYANLTPRLRPPLEHPIKRSQRLFETFLVFMV